MDGAYILFIDKKNYIGLRVNKIQVNSAKKLSLNRDYLCIFELVFCRREQVGSLLIIVKLVQAGILLLRLFSLCSLGSIIMDYYEFKIKPPVFTRSVPSLRVVIVQSPGVWEGVMIHKWVWVVFIGLLGLSTFSSLVFYIFLFSMLYLCYNFLLYVLLFILFCIL